MTPKRIRGFTLIELLVTMMIMVAILLVAVPQFARAMTGLQLRESTQTIAAMLRQTRNSAITSAKEATLLLNMEKQTLLADGAGAAYRWPDDIKVEPVNDDTALLATDMTIHFYPDGTASAALLSISAGEREYVVAVDWLTGRVKVL